MNNIKYNIFVLFLGVMIFSTQRICLSNTLTTAEVFLDDPNLQIGLGIPLTLESGIDIVDAAGGIINMTDIAPGAHTIYYRFRDDDGSWSSPLGISIYVTPGNPSNPFKGGENYLLSAEVFIDEDPGQGNGIELSVALDGQIDSTIEQLSRKLSNYNLDKGLHVWHTRFLDRTGIWSPTTKVSFYTPTAITSENNSFWLLVLPAILGAKK